MKKRSFDILEKFYRSVVFDENIFNLPEERLSIYRNLVFNNIEDTCSKAFPIAKLFLNKKWEKLISEFLKKHKFTSPYLWEVPKEFIDFLYTKNFFQDKPLLKEIMLYEWIEIELFNEDIPVMESEFSWYRVYRFSNTARLFSFDYPVHRVSELENLELHRGKYYLIIYQNPENNNVEYLEITKFLFQILEKINSGKILDITNKVCNLYNMTFESVSEKLKDFFYVLLKNKIIV